MYSGTYCCDSFFFFLQVIHEFPVVYGCDGETTARSDYVRHNVVALEQGRLEAMRTNKVRHNNNNIIMTLVINYLRLLCMWVLICAGDA